MKKILVIDDDVTTRVSVARGFESRGFTVIQSSNGKQGWDTIWNNPDICLVVSDIMMPDMDGRELLYIIRGNQTFCQLPVILVSGVANDESVRDLLEMGKTKFFPKPLDLGKLAQTANELLGETSATGCCQH